LQAASFSDVSKGLSKLLSMLIGLVVVIVAGIAITNSFYQYVYPISIRPAVMIEYVNLIEAGNNDMLILNLKNIGNVPVDVQHVVVDGVGDVDCRIAGSGSPGTTFSIVCSGNILSGYDGSISGIARIGFIDGSSMALIFKAGRGQAVAIGTITGTLTTTIETQDFDIYFDPSDVAAKPGLSRSSTLRIISENYEGEVTLNVESCPSDWVCYLSRNNVYLPRNGDASVTLTFSVPSIIETRNYVIIVSAQDSSSRIKTTSLTVIVQDFKIDVIEDSISGKVGSDAQVTVKIIPLNGYRGNINLSYQGGVEKGKFNPNPVSVSGQDKEAVFTFKIIGPPGEKTVTVTGVDEDDIIRSDNFKVNAEAGH